MVNIQKQSKMNKYLKLILILSILFPITVFAQNKIEGIFILPSPTGDFSTSLTFDKNGTFQYEHSAHLGVEEYGEGTYSLTKKEIILNYNLTKPLKKSFYESEFWINDNDKIQLNINAKDLAGNNISGANIYILADKTGVITDNNGYGELVLKKDNQNSELIVSFVGYDEIRIPFHQKYSYNFNVYLRKWVKGTTPKPILNQVETLKIIKRNRNELVTINERNQKQIWTRFE